MAMHSIQELFEHELRDIYGGEQLLLDSLRQMSEEAQDSDVRKTFAQHRRETQSQLKRLEKIFKLIGLKPKAATCAGIQGLIREKTLLMREKPSPELLEFFNVAAAQKVERYEITVYETLMDMAEKLGIGEAVELLEQSLLEEESALNKLKVHASEYDVAEVQSS